MAADLYSHGYKVAVMGNWKGASMEGWPEFYSKVAHMSAHDRGLATHQFCSTYSQQQCYVHFALS